MDLFGPLLAGIDLTKAAENAFGTGLAVGLPLFHLCPRWPLHSAFRLQARLQNLRNVGSKSRTKPIDSSSTRPRSYTPSSTLTGSPRRVSLRRASIYPAYSPRRRTSARPGNIPRPRLNNRRDATHPAPIHAERPGRKLLSEEKPLQPDNASPRPYRTASKLTPPRS